MVGRGGGGGGGGGDLYSVLEDNAVLVVDFGDFKYINSLWRWVDKLTRKNNNHKRKKT